MDLTKLTQNEEIPIVVTTKFCPEAFGHQKFEVLSTEREPGNLVEKYAATWKRWKLCENCVLFFENR